MHESLTLPAWAGCLRSMWRRRLNVLSKVRGQYMQETCGFPEEGRVGRVGSGGVVGSWAGMASVVELANMASEWGSSGRWKDEE